MQTGYEYTQLKLVSQSTLLIWTIPEEKEGILEEAHDEVAQLLKSITKVLLLTVRDITRLLMFGHKQQRNLLRL